jgi:ribonuclease HII
VYGFEKHVGYGTQLHHIMLKNYGPSKIHRRSFAPVKAVIRT